MRKKGNLDTRIKECGDILLASEGTFTNVKEYIKQKEYIDYKKVFNNDNPIYLDIGCGLGGFAIEFAKQNPNINLIAIEMFSNVIIGAIDKAQKENLSNLRFLNIRCECLEKFIKDESIEKIFLNFSNPLHNKSDEKQRLTNQRFLEIYKKLLTSDGIICQKTDDKDFFEYSLQSFKDCGYIILDECWDLAKLNDKDNIVTEHEQKYISQGKTIYRVIVKKP